MSIYDPIFTTEDHLLFKELNMKVTTNKACVFLNITFEAHANDILFSSFRIIV